MENHRDTPTGLPLNSGLQNWISNTTGSFLGRQLTDAPYKITSAASGFWIQLKTVLYLTVFVLKTLLNLVIRTELTP